MKLIMIRLVAVLLVVHLCNGAIAQTVADSFWVKDTTPNPSNIISGDTVLHIPYKINKQYLKSYWTDLKYTVSRPAHWDGKDWTKFSIIMGTVGTTMMFDKKIKSIALHNRNNFTNSVAHVIEPFGNMYGMYLFPAIYAAGLATKSNQVKHIGLQGGKSLIISTVVYTAAKKMIRRRRPDATDSPFDYALPFAKQKYTSSPSGHTNTIFTVATGLALEFPEKKWVAPVAYSIASLTAISRIYHNRHWASDVVLGAALGHFVTKAVWKSSHKKRRPLFQ